MAHLPPRLLPPLRIALVALGLLGGSALAACHSHASADDCREMEDRYLDLAVAEAPGAATLTPAQTTAVRDVERGLKRAAPAYRMVEDHCAAVTRAEVSCAKDAKTTQAWEACVQAPDAR